MKRIGAKLMLVAASLALALGLTAGPAAASSYYSGTKYTYTGTTWQGWVWGGIENPTTGWNMYLRIDNGDTPSMYVRWTSCSGTSSGANKLSGSTPFQGALGTGFLAGTCALPYSRFVNTSSSGSNYAVFETYFNNQYIY